VTQAPPPLSVLMPVYNTRPYLREAITSVLGQSFGDFELIVVDDGSTDGSREIAEELTRDESRLRVFERSRLGVARVLNEGLQLCRSPLIARMDSDDIALPRRFELQLAYLGERSDCVLVGGQADMIDEEGDPFGWINTPLDHDDIVAGLERGEGAIVHPTAMYRAAAVRDAGGYRADRLAEDVDLFLRLSSQGRVANLPHQLLRYRKRESSVTSHWDDAAVNAERRNRAAQHLSKGDVPASRVTPYKEPPRDDALRIARMGIAVHAGFYRTATKYARRLLTRKPASPRLWLAVAARLARSLALRLLRPPVVPQQSVAR